MVNFGILPFARWLSRGHAPRGGPPDWTIVTEQNSKNLTFITKLIESTQLQERNEEMALKNYNPMTLDDEMASHIEQARKDIEEAKQSGSLKTVPEQLIETHQKALGALRERLLHHDAEVARNAKLAAEDRLGIKALEMGIKILQDEGGKIPAAVDKTVAASKNGNGENEQKN